MIKFISLNRDKAIQYRDLMLEAYLSHPEAFTSTHAERSLHPDSWWQERLSSSNQFFQTIGALESDQLVGCVGIEFYHRHKTKHKAKLVGMYVKPEYRGKGVGSQMLDQAIETARQRHGISSLLLSVTANNAAAIKLYETVGFVAYGTEPAAIDVSGQLLAKVYMRLALED